MVQLLPTPVGLVMSKCCLRLFSERAVDIFEDRGLVTKPFVLPLGRFLVDHRAEPLFEV
jgi:hypothetical protein